MIIAKKAPKAERQLLKNIFEQACELKRAELKGDGLGVLDAKKSLTKLRRTYTQMSKSV